MARTLLIEDDAKIGAYLEQGLREERHTVEWVRDGHEGLERLLYQQYEVAILDVMLPGIDGLEVLRRARARACHTPIIMLSASSEVNHRVAGLAAGADDYVGKPFSFTELVARIEALLRRSQGRSAQVTELAFGGLEMDLLKRTVRRDGELLELQPKEFALLEYLLRNAERVLSKTMILEHVWGYDFDPQTNVVDVLVSRLRQKVDRDRPDKLLHTIRGIGYVLRAR